MAATLDQILAQEQLHYQVIKQNIDNLYLNLNSANNSQTNAIISQINNQTNNLGGQLYTQASRVITAISGQAVTLEHEVLGTINTRIGAVNANLANVQTNLQLKLDSVLAQTKAEIDKEQGIVTSNLLNGIDKLYTVTINVGGEVKTLQAKIEGELNSKIDNVTLHDKENADRLQGTINDIIIKQTTSTTDNVTKTLSGLIGTNSPLGTTEQQLMQAVLDDLQKHSSDGSTTPSDTFFTALIRLISGNQTADVFNAIDTADITGNILDQVTKLSSIEQNVLDGKYKTLDDLNHDLKQIGVDSPVLGALLQLPFIIANLGDVAKGFFLPTLTKIEQLMVAAYSLKQLNESDLLTAFVKNNMSAEDVHKNLDNIGHSSDDSTLLMKNAEPKMNIQDLFKLAHLGKISDKELFNRMREIGWDEITTILYGYVNAPRPGVNDLISFAVKEVYSPEVTAKFGQFQDFPKEFEDQSKLLGLDVNFAKQYWAAHWALPGAQQGFELFHRGIITHDDLSTLLKALDVMPFWRDKLIQLSYNLVTRVDVRRLYAYGIWTQDKVYQSYLRSGYSPEDAKDLTNFTIQYDDEQDNKHKTYLQKKAHDIYIASYNANLIDKNTAINKLVSVGYKQKDIELELSLEDYEQYVKLHAPKSLNHIAKILAITSDGYKKRSIPRIDFLGTYTQNGYTLAEANTEADLIDKEANILYKETIIKEIQRLYFESLLDDNGVLNQLNKNGFGNAEALEIIGQLKTLKGLDDKKPNQQQFQKAFANGIITETQYKQELADIGYNEKYLDLLVKIGEL